ncbi:DNA-3-methyladenine glycosylase I [Marinibactrum halimedae]|uniref:DNA-3-methyladenine glycosylase I n=1 Tax=Marinibactrum halimedae TaxID=1444977 RepID=A0AA37TBZ3_9GAMM|nr:DNA-3-methyladenine glycosylase I [Marinibactrum halimedae]MCD9457857.1 DNA-3-methyladenine glycosylase I [Marinibactrum halimedae]GLS26322.1 hypothetical protein GCM10007877_20370 [Marinibactrum halimedae]
MALTFERIYETACLHKGGDDAVEASLPTPLSDAKLKSVSDAECLSLLSLRIFRAGLKHSLVDSKWPAFSEVFHGFDPIQSAMLSDEEVERMMENTSIIRHLGKLKSVRTNAQMILHIREEYAGFGEFLAQWPTSDVIGLWHYLKSHGAQLGGMSAPRFLRMVGKDTFLLTDDVVMALKGMGIIHKPPTAKRDLHRVQETFNGWCEESGRPLCQVSRILSYTCNANL